MSLHPQEPPSVPEETNRVARAAFPKGSLCLQIADELGSIYTDDQFSARPPSQTGLPQLPGSPFQHAVPITPMDQNGCVCRLLPRSTRPSPLFRRVGVHDFTFEACSGFTHVTACWIAQPPKGGLCHEASARPVTPTNRSSATRSYRQLPGWILPPLVNRAVGAH